MLSFWCVVCIKLLCNHELHWQHFECYIQLYNEIAVCMGY